MVVKNEMKLEIKSQTVNISFGRAVVAAFISQLDPIVPEVEDISTAVSEAITNAIVHGYKGDPNGIIRIMVRLLAGNQVEIIVEDYGVGISDLAAARQFGKTSQPEERIGIGFNLMEQCMDEVILGTSSKDNGSRLKTSGFMQFFRQGLGLGKKIGKKTGLDGPGTRVTMRKRLQPAQV
ncbi:MAG: anti-sigma F factor [Firmicutes bacterium]|nr:anti-sigma F factor [Bacillota bacterium]